MVGAIAADRLREGGRALPAVGPQWFLNWCEQRYYARHGEVELHLVPHLCRPTRDALDIGAGDGCYVHGLRQHARHVIAFEPLPWLARKLETKFHRDIRRGRVTVRALALSSAQGSSVLRVPVVDGRHIEAGSSLSPAVAAKHALTRDVPVRTAPLDAAYGGNAGFIKIDVEGHEEEVLAGALRTIRRCQPRLQIEVEESIAPGALARIAAGLRKLGYHGYFVYRRQLLPLERFDPAVMQNPADCPDRTATPERRQRFGDFIRNFLFLPADEPPSTRYRIAQHVARL